MAAVGTAQDFSSADSLQESQARMIAEPASSDRVSEPTLASESHAVSRRGITDDLLDWPPDLFA